MKHKRKARAVRYPTFEELRDAQRKRFWRALRLDLAGLVIPAVIVLAAIAVMILSTKP